MPATAETLVSGDMLSPFLCGRQRAIGWYRVIEKCIEFGPLGILLHWYTFAPAFSRADAFSIS